MTTIQASSSKQKQKHAKRKHRSRHHKDLVISPIPLLNNEHQQTHELLSDWSDAS